MNSIKNVSFLVLGGGAAALYSAKTIRENSDKEILMISEESLLPYRRPQLTKDMMGSFYNNEKAVFKQDWFDNNNIKINLNETVTKINPENKTVETNKAVYKYETLIYALGAKCFVPGIEGSTLPEVVTVRSIKDVDKIKELSKTITNVVVIGGGVLGLEAAYEMKKLNKNVVVLEVMPQIMGRQLDLTASTLLTNIVKKQGVDVITGAAIERIDGTNKVEGVLLKGDKYIKADMVIVSAGIASNVQIAKEAGIECNRAIIVDENMKTNIEDIYACGDCAEFEKMNYALWPEASSMAKVAGANASGKSETYKSALYGLTFSDFETKLFAIGDAGKIENAHYETKEMLDEEKGLYEKFYILDNILVGAILIGDNSKMMEVLSKINKPINE